MNLIFKHLGIIDYAACWQEMRDFTQNRTADTTDEIWILEHPPVVTQGQTGKDAHIKQLGDIPLVLSDRGGQVTYHAPGQLVAYCLLDLRRRKTGIKLIVKTLENVALEVLRDFGIEAHLRLGESGVYVEDKKIAALGLRVTQKGSYHGMSINVRMDLEPWRRINACGLGLEVIDMASLIDTIDQSAVEAILKSSLEKALNENNLA